MGHPNLYLEHNGLIRTEGRYQAVTWMNSTINGKPVVPRTGYIVEFNALWFNALCFAEELATKQNDNKRAEQLRERMARCHQSFAATFYNKYGYRKTGAYVQTWYLHAHSTIRH